MVRPTLGLFALLALPGLCLAAKPDLTGVWSITSDDSTLKTVDGKTPPLTPAADALYKKHLAEAAKGDRSFDGVTTCLPPGLPRLMLEKEPFEIMQRDKAVYIVSQVNRLPRRAYFNEKLPTDVDPEYLGFSVAKWDGDTLVIDSSGFRDITLLDDSGLPHSEDMHLTERYTLSKDGKELHARFRIDDPKTFTRPWEARAEYKKLPGYEIPEEVCADQLASKKRKE
ncbi:MAG TPA: hypothetical protein VN750_04290 [Steroidobacteraceae bacterium]|nr:hypothetical protein [Steroidobacteraceae bacterium]